MTGEFSGKAAVVTGGSRGIGLAIARGLRAAGADVAIVARKPEQLEVARHDLLDSPGSGQVLALTGNAGEADQAQACIDMVVGELGRVDVLVNNAATNPYMGRLIDIDYSRAEKTSRVNQFGMLGWTKHAHRVWMGEHGGTVVNIASVGGMIVDPGIGYYNATKAAILLMTRQMAYELGPQVRVNAVAPGVIKTDMARAVWEAREAVLSKTLPLRRLGTVEDVAEAAMFLAGPRSSWITGQTLVIDGGALTLPIAVDA